MRKLFIALLGVLLVLLLALGIATWRLSQPKFEESLRGDPQESLTVAPPETALTLARVGAGNRARVVLVIDARPDGLAVIDLESAFGRPFRDAVDAFHELGYEALEQAAGGPATERLALIDLGLPFDPADPHIAAGTNYRAHAEEVGLEEGPFLFPKLSMPTPWNADVPPKTRLDYEAELCAVTLTPHTPSSPARLGYLLCNDFTDRWKLLEGLDFDEPMGTTGFPDAKGGDGMLPVGPFLVIPRQADGFHRDLVLELYVNGRLRQRARAGLMIWSPSEIVARAFDDCDVVYQRSEGTVGLTDCTAIPARTLILTGTPGGVMFHVLTVWYPGAYLERGDEVWTLAPFLGVLHNRVR